MEERLQRCFNTLNFTWEDWKKLSRKRTPKKFQEVYEKLAEATPIPSAILRPIREVIDSTFQDHLGSLSVFALPESSAWSSAWESYQFTLPNAVKETVQRIVDDGLATSLPADVLAALSTCPAKIAVILNASEVQDELENYTYFPFMCRSVLERLEQHFRGVEKAVLEVVSRYVFPHVTDLCFPHQISSWFSPFVYMVKAHGNHWNTRSASAEMMRAVMGHPSFTSLERIKTLDAVSQK